VPPNIRFKDISAGMVLRGSQLVAILQLAPSAFYDYYSVSVQTPTGRQPPPPALAARFFCFLTFLPPLFSD